MQVLTVCSERKIEFQIFQMFCFSDTYVYIYIYMVFWIFSLQVVAYSRNCQLSHNMGRVRYTYRWPVPLIQVEHLPFGHVSTKWFCHEILKFKRKWIKFWGGFWSICGFFDMVDNFIVECTTVSICCCFGFLDIF